MSSYAARRTALRQKLQAADLDALLVTNLLNVRYLTGFTGSNAAVLIDAVSDDKTVFCTDGRYLTQSAKQVPDLERLIDRPCDIALARKVKGRLGFESHHVTVDGLEALTAAAEKAELEKASGLVERLRLVKDEVEIEALRMACAAADRALAALIGHGALRAGRTEREVARELESRMLDHGAEGPSFSSIVAFGANSAVPHHSPTDVELAVGDLVKLDFGALVDGYHSDMTRTVVLGRASNELKDGFEAVRQAQEYTLGLMKPGASPRDIHAAHNAYMQQRGLPPELRLYAHGQGYDMVERPLIRSDETMPLAANMNFAVHPGYETPSIFAVICDNYIVGEDGPGECLHTTAKQVFEL